MSMLLRLAIFSILVAPNGVAGDTKTFVDFTNDVTYSPPEAWQSGPLDIACNIADVGYFTRKDNTSVQFQFLGASPLQSTRRLV